MAVNVHAIPTHDGWAVRRAGARRTLSRFRTRSEAWREARRLARGSGAVAYLHGADGRVLVRSGYDGPLPERQPARSAAVLTIHRAPDMSPKGRRQVAAWLRRHADMLVKEGRNYTRGRFTGRYLYA